MFLSAAAGCVHENEVNVWKRPVSLQICAGNLHGRNLWGSIANTLIQSDDYVVSGQSDDATSNELSKFTPKEIGPRLTYGVLFGGNAQSILERVRSWMLQFRLTWIQ